MTDKQKKTLIYIGLAVDILATLFFFIISIIMIIKSLTMSSIEIQQADQSCIIGFLQNHTTIYLVGFVIPLFLLLALNIILLVVYVKKTSKAKVEVKDLSSEQLEALKKELLNDITNDNKKR